MLSQTQNSPAPGPFWIPPTDPAAASLLLCSPCSSQDEAAGLCSRRGSPSGRVCGARTPRGAALAGGSPQPIASPFSGEPLLQPDPAESQPRDPVSCGLMVGELRGPLRWPETLQSWSWAIAPARGCSGAGGDARGCAGMLQLGAGPGKPPRCFMYQTVIRSKGQGGAKAH